MKNEHNDARRKIIGGLGMGIASISGYPLLGTSTLTEDVAEENELIDPTTKYAKPPFKEQLQAWPGLAGKMNPKPDHGEKSYKGSGRLLGRKR